MPDNPTCATCRWWADRYAHLTEVEWPMRQRAGECHRLAPTRDRPVWPYTESDDWCGEHAPRAEAPKGGVDLGAGDDRTVISVPDAASYISAALDHGIDVTYAPKPGDSFTLGRTTWIYQPKEPPDARP